MSKIELHLAAVPTDPEAQLRLVLGLFRKLTGKDPTPEEVAETRTILGVPPSQTSSPTSG